MHGNCCTATMKTHLTLGILGLFAVCSCNSAPSSFGDEPGSVDKDVGLSDSGETDATADEPVDDVEASDSESSVPLPAAPCAEDLDADLHPESSVDEVTGTVEPDCGPVDPRPLSRDPSAKGPYEVSTSEVLVPIVAQSATVLGRKVSVKPGRLKAVLFLPKPKDGPPVSGSYPLILTLPGFSASHRDYDHFGLFLASHGFVVMGLATRSNLLVASHDKEALEVLQALDWMLSGDSPAASMLDGEKIALCGASKGGKVAFLAASLDARIDAVVGFDPSNGGGPPCSLAPSFLCNALPVAPNCVTREPGVLHLIHAESLVFGAPRDPAQNPDRHHNAIHFYRGAPSPASFVQYNGQHTAPMNNDRIIALINKVQTAFFLSRFYGATDVDRFLPDTAEGKTALESEELVIRVESK